MTHARKPRRKQYRPRPARLPMLIKAQQTLAPLEAIIDQIDRDGTVTTNARGVPIFLCLEDGEWYASAPAMPAMAALHREIPALRRIGAGLTQDDASDLLRQTQIRAELDAARAQGA